MKLAESSSMESTCATRARLGMRSASIRSQIGRVRRFRRREKGNWGPNRPKLEEKRGNVTRQGFKPHQSTGTQIIVSEFFAQIKAQG
jgi:hypothetical protein